MTNESGMTTFLQPGDRETLKEIVATSTSDTRRKRAQLLLDIESGLSIREIAEKMGSPVQRVVYWRREYLKRGLSLFD